MSPTAVPSEMIQPGRLMSEREIVAARILAGFDLQSVVEVMDVLAMVDRFQKHLAEHFNPKVCAG